MLGAIGHWRKKPRLPLLASNSLFKRFIVVPYLVAVMFSFLVARNLIVDGGWRADIEGLVLCTVGGALALAGIGFLMRPTQAGADPRS